MAISINWGTRVIFIPRTDLTLIQSTPTEIRELNLNSFRLVLKDLEDDIEGMPYPRTHKHNTEVLLGGINYARTIEIINDYSITFEDGQYAVNLVGANSNVGDRINLNQVSVRSANSAGLISSQDIEFASYNGGVTIDVNSPHSGTLHPIGTDRKKVNNTQDALLIAKYRGFNKLYLHSNITIDSGLDYSGMVFQGRNHTTISVIISDAADVTDITIRECDVEGVLDGGTDIDSCIVRNLVFFNGHIHNSSLAGTIFMAGTQDALILRSVQLTPDIQPVINMLNSTQNLVVTNYVGEIRIEELSNIDCKVTVGLSQGRIILDSATCTEGTVEVIGTGYLVDENGSYIRSGIWNGGVVVINGLLNVDAISRGLRTDIWLDTNSILNGDGKPETPFNNFADAYQESVNSKIDSFVINGVVVITDTNLDGYAFKGHNALNAVVVLSGAGNSTKRTQFYNLILTGTVNGSVYADTCGIEALSEIGSNLFPTLFNHCIIRPDTSPTIPTIKFKNGLTTPQNIHFLDCKSGVPGQGTATIDYNNSSSPIGVRNYNGGFLLKNHNQNIQHTFELMPGQFKLDTATVTNGSFVLRGIGKLIDELGNLIPSGLWNGVTIINELLTASVIGNAGVWTEQEKQESLAWSRKASDNAEQTNLKL